jgi:hypothetical protein
MCTWSHKFVHGVATLQSSSTDQSIFERLYSDASLSKGDFGITWWGATDLKSKRSNFKERRLFVADRTLIST